MAPKRRGKPAAQQPTRERSFAELGVLPKIDKPATVVGEQINVPGEFWEGRQSAEERTTLYKCTVRAFTALHVFHGGAKGAAFEMQEMGQTGTGSLEAGDASGEVFHMMCTRSRSSSTIMPRSRIGCRGEPAAKDGRRSSSFRARST